MEEWLGKWHGMFTKLLLWSRHDLFDTILLMDSDHLVLRNIDNLLRVCGDDLCAANERTQFRTWDLEVNAAFAKRKMERKKKSTQYSTGCSYRKCITEVCLDARFEIVLTRLALFSSS